MANIYTQIMIFSWEAGPSGSGPGLPSRSPSKQNLSPLRGFPGQAGAWLGHFCSAVVKL